MKRALRRLVLLVLFAGLGWGVSELLFHWHVTRPLLARLLGAKADSPAVANLRRESAGEQISDTVLDGELDLLLHQFADENAFSQALEASGSSMQALRVRLSEHLRARQWLENKIGPHKVTEAECRAFYDAAPKQFTQPQRFRVRHLFLAAPPGTAPEAVAAKRTLIQGLAIRLLAGENFNALVAEASEDEATRARAGDLGYFSALRMPTDFMAEVEKLRPGEFSAPVQSQLGFHILQLTDRKPPRPLAFDAVKAEIANILANKKRATAVQRLSEAMNATDWVAR